MIEIVKQFEKLNFNKLMQVYEESNTLNAKAYVKEDNISFEDALLKSKESFYSFLKNNFFVKNNGMFFILKDENGEYKAALRIEEYEENKFFLQGLETKLDCRNCGFSTTLLKETISYLEEKRGNIEIRCSILEDNVSSIKSHLKVAFRKELIYGYKNIYTKERYKKSYIGYLYKSKSANLNPNTYYHGTNNGEIKVFKPISKSHSQEKDVVYLTNIYSYALLYIRDMDLDFVTAYVNKENKVVYEELFFNQLEYLYKERSGFIYKFNLNNAKLSKTNGIFEVKDEIKVFEVLKINDVYSEIKNCIDSGDIIVKKVYEEEKSKTLEFYQVLKNQLNNVQNKKKREFYNKIIIDYFES